MTDLMLYASLKASILLALAWLATVLLRRASADLRHRIWLVALFGTVVLTLPLPVPEGVTIAVSAGLGVKDLATPRNAGAISWIPILWTIGFTIVIVRFAAGVVRLKRITRSASTSTIPGVVVSESITSPMTWGAFRPVILFPAYVMDWSDEKLDVVLRHERAHIARRDWLWQSFAQIVTALFWFHPLVWIAAERLRQEAEHATDDVVLTSGSDAAGYADQLLEVVRQMRGSAPHVAVAVTMVRQSALTSRVAAILDPSRPRTPAGVRVRAMIAVSAVCLVAVLAACQQARGQVFTFGNGISAPVAIYRPEPRYSEAARRAKWQGTVRVSLVVDAHGHPQQVHVIKPLGFGLDEMAVEAVEKWIFKPGRNNGKPVPVQATIEVNFKLL